jgi:F-type H+-transporting ATPase subunit epsilon
LEVSIVSAEREVWRGDAEMVVARSPEGEFGIMRGHIPFLAALVPGLVKVHTSGSSIETFLVTGGFLEASGSMDDYHVILLADDAEEVGEIDDAEVARRIEAIRASQAEQDTSERSEAALRGSLAAGERASGEYSSAG